MKLRIRETVKTGRENVIFFCKKQATACASNNAAQTAVRQPVLGSCSLTALSHTAALCFKYHRAGILIIYL